MRNIKKIHIADKAHENRLRDIILGGQDGLVNVLGIVLGVAVASNNTEILITAALAAAFAEAISMGAVAYTSEVSEHDRYLKEKEQEMKNADENPEEEREEIRKIYEQKGFSGKLLEDVVATITSNKKVWIDTMMDEELRVADVPPKSVLLSSVIVGAASLVGALIPVVPFFFLPKDTAITLALVLSMVSLFTLGAFEAKTYVGTWWKHGLRILLIGMGAAAAGYIIGVIFGNGNL